MITALSTTAFFVSIALIAKGFMQWLVIIPHLDLTPQDPTACKAHRP